MLLAAMALAAQADVESTINSDSNIEINGNIIPSLHLLEDNCNNNASILFSLATPVEDSINILPKINVKQKYH